MKKTLAIWNEFAPNYSQGFVERLYGRLFREAFVYQLERIPGSIGKGYICVDAGCAVGNNFDLLLGYGAKHILGLDFSSQMLKLAAKRVNRLGAANKVTLKLHDLTKDLIPLRDCTAGLVVNQIVNCYLTPAQREFCFSEFGRVTKRGGLAVGSGLGPRFRLPAAVQDNQKREGHMDLLQNVIGPLLGGIQQLIKNGEISPASSKEMERLLENNDFEVLCIDTPPGLENPDDPYDPDYVVRWLGRKK